MTRRITIDRVFWGWVIAGVLASLGVAALYAHYVKLLDGWQGGMPWEIALLEVVHHPLPRVLDWLMLFIPWLGTNITILPGVIIASWLFHKRGRNDLIAALVAAAAGNYVIGFALKFAFDRPRPSLWPGRGEYTGPSYPSGHAMMATSVLFVIAYLLHRERRWHWPYYASMAFGLVTIYSRLYLGVHWPTDVVAGMVIGMVWLAAMLRAMRASTPLDRRGSVRVEASMITTTD